MTDPVEELVEKVLPKSVSSLEADGTISTSNVVKRGDCVIALKRALTSGLLVEGKRLEAALERIKELEKA